MIKIIPLNSLFYTFLFLFCISTDLVAKEYNVSSASDIESVNKKLRPGDVVIMKSGVWHNQTIELDVKGNEKKPILLKAEIPGEVLLTGKSSLRVKGSYVVVSGLLFTDGYLESGHVIRLDGHHHRVTQTRISGYNPPSQKTQFMWLSLNGSHHRVDHNAFTGQDHKGVTNVVWLKGKVNGHHRIDHNYYGQRAAGDGNGYETIRIGTGDYSHIDANTVVEHNVFEELDGEIEIISNKSNKNIYRFNTFKNNSGTLTIRQGNQSIVDSNFFLGDYRKGVRGKKGVGGVRVVGIDHMIANNHFQQLSGRSNGIVSITAGNGLMSDKKRPAYPRVENLIIGGNTCVDNNGPCVYLNASLGTRKRDYLPNNVLLMNNVFYNQDSSVELVSGKQNSTVISADNYISGVTSADTSSENESVKSLVAKYTNFTCQGLARQLQEKSWPDQEKPMALCEQLSKGNVLSTSTPKTKKDVGPSWEI